jgi:hypothetical protein
VTSAIPTGGALDSSTSGGAAPLAPGTVANPTWLPPFRLGQGLTGVFADARGLIAGEPATATGIPAAATGTGGAGTDSGTGPPAAGSMPTGGNSGNVNPLINNAPANHSGFGGGTQKTPPPASAFNSQGQYIGDGLGNS